MSWTVCWILDYIQFSHPTTPSLSVPPTLPFSMVFTPAKSPAEESLIGVLAKAFPNATDIAVVDVSGGCGSMYEAGLHNIL